MQSRFNIQSVKQFMRRAWGLLGPSVLFAIGVGTVWLLLFNDLIFAPIIALVLGIFHWVDHNVKSKYPGAAPQKSPFKKNWAILEDDSGAHSGSIYRGLGKAFEGYYLNEQTLELID